MSVQTTYSADMVKGFKGMLAEQFSMRQVDSGLVETAAVGLGVALAAGSADGQYVAAAADAAVLGISLYEPTRELASGGSYEYAVKEEMPVLKKGRIWMIANGALAVGAEVAYDPATGKVGAVSAGVTTLAMGVAVSSSSADGDLIVIEFDWTWH
jgi:hypothetical protein